MMAKRIEYEGKVHVFPDDFTDEDIAAALESEATQAPVSAGQPGQPASGQAGRSSNPLDMVIAGARDRVAPFALNAADSGSFGTLDEITGAIRGGAVLQRDAQQRASQGGLPGAITEGVGHFARPFQAFAQRVTGTESPEVQAARKTGEEQVRSGLASARENYPVTSLTGSVAGALPLAAAGGGGGVPARLGGRVMQGMGIGGATGVVYGYNSGEDGNRLANAAIGGVVGAGTGAAVPVAFKGAEVLGNRANALAMSIPAVREAANAVDNFFYQRTPEPGRAALNMMAIGIPPKQRPPRATPRFQPPTDPISGRAARLADRADMTPEQIDARIAAFQADPRGRTMAEVFDDEGIHAAATVARMPGQTRNLATEQMEARNAGQAGRLDRDLSGQTDQSAVDFFSERTRDVAEQYFEPVWRQAPTPADEAFFQHFLRRPEVAEAEAAARRTMQGLIARGRLPPEALSDPAHVLHYIKMEIADTIQNPLKVKAGVRSTNNGNLAAAVEDISTALGLLRPGYSEAMQQFQQAIGPRELAKRMATVRGESPNVAANIARNPDVMRDIGRLGLNNFGRAVTEESRLYRNASRMIPSTNSQSTPFAASMMDEAAMGGQQIPTSREGLLSAALGYFRNGLNETRRNEYGRFLFRVVDDPQSGLTAAERQAITRELAKIQAQRAAQTTATRATAGGAAVAGNNALNQ